MNLALFVQLPWWWGCHTEVWKSWNPHPSTSSARLLRQRHRSSLETKRITSQLKWSERLVICASWALEVVLDVALSEEELLGSRRSAAWDFELYCPRRPFPPEKMPPFPPPPSKKEESKKRRERPKKNNNTTLKAPVPGPLLGHLARGLGCSLRPLRRRPQRHRAPCGGWEAEGGPTRFRVSGFGEFFCSNGHRNNSC